MTLQTILEEDREQLMASLSGADAPGAVRALNGELDRMLYTFNDREESARVREAASDLLRTAKASCSLMDSAGETKIYGRTEYGAAPPEKGKLPRGGLLLLLLGVIGAAATVVGALMLASGAQGAPPRWLLAGVPLLSFAACLLAGRFLRRGKERAKETLHAETKTDPSLVYTHLLSVILVIDQCLEEVRNEDRREEKERAEAGIAALDGGELELLSQLLEDAYGRRGQDELAAEEISQIGFYLHRKGVDVVDWTGEDAVSGPGGAAAAAVNSAWFDMMPAYEGGTLRPALVADGKLLKKGMASAGRG